MISFFCFIATAFGLVGSAPAYCFAPIAALFGIHWVFRVCRRAFAEKDFDALMFQGVVLSAFLLYMLLKKESSLFYHILTEISLGFSGLAGAFAGRSVSMGVTYSGLDLVCLFLIAAAVASAFWCEGSRLRLAARFVVLFPIWGMYVALWTLLAENGLSLGLGFLEPMTGPLDYRALLFAFLLAAHMAGPGRRREKAAPFLAKGKARAGVATAAALCAAIFFLSFVGPKAPETPEGKRVVFWDSGIDFSLPEKGRYGLENAGMFGFLPRYLETRGYSCAIVGAPDAKALKSADLLVIINPMSTPDAEALDAIRDFVEGGGGLLAAGDHTGGEQIRLPLNAILAPAGISLNFDSATPFKALWADEFVTRRSPVFAGVSAGQIQTVVGASLELSRPAKPLLVGRCGYSDAGDAANAADGFLGDRQFNRGERVGDLILAAAAECGKGRIAAFGDTSFLQNIGIAYSYPLIDNLFAWLAGASAGGAPGGARSDGGGGSTGGSVGGVSAGEGESADGGAAGDWAAGGAGGPIPYSASCLLDASHLPSFSRDKSGGAADGFIAAALRAGLTPYVDMDGPIGAPPPGAGDPKVIALVEPALALSGSELSALDAFVEGGGTLMLFGTYGSPRATRELFEHFGFSFERLPIGRVSPEMAPEMALRNACPLLYEGRPAAEASGAAESLLEVWGYGVAVRLSVGAGTVYAFGDGDFIKNDNLESADAYRKGNVDFVEALLKAASGNELAPGNDAASGGELAPGNEDASGGELAPGNEAASGGEPAEGREARE